MRDTTGAFDRIGLGVVNKHCLEPVVQMGLEPDKCNTVYLECVLEVGEKGGVVDRVKGSRQFYECKT